MTRTTVADLETIQPLSKPYQAPQYLVEPSSTIWNHTDSMLPEGTTVEVLDTDVRGWGAHNAIVKLEFPDGDWTDALAVIRSGSSEGGNA